MPSASTIGEFAQVSGWYCRRKPREWGHNWEYRLPQPNAETRKGRWRSEAYPTVSLAEARERRDADRKLLSSGIDPNHQKKLDKIKGKVAAANTFTAVDEEWLEKEQ